MIKERIQSLFSATQHQLGKHFIPRKHPSSLLTHQVISPSVMSCAKYLLSILITTLCMLYIIIYQQGLWPWSFSGASTCVVLVCSPTTKLICQLHTMELASIQPQSTQDHLFIRFTLLAGKRGIKRSCPRCFQGYDTQIFWPSRIYLCPCGLGRSRS